MIFLCNDDKQREGNDLNIFAPQSANEWRDAVLTERDRKVQQIEEKLNAEVKIANKELKRRMKLENEFKSLNKKKNFSVCSGVSTRQMDSQNSR